MLGLLPLIMDGRPARLRRALRRGCRLQVFTTPLWRLFPWAVLDGLLRVGSQAVLLHRVSLVRGPRRLSLRRRGRPFAPLVLVLLPHDCVMRLVAVVLVVQLFPLLRLGIPIP